MLQQQLFDVRQELGSVNAELSHAERRLRHEVREEMEQRMQKFERRTMDKVAFFKQRQESNQHVMRKASKAQLESAKVHAEHRFRTEADASKAVLEAMLSAMRQDLEQKDLLIQGYKRDGQALKEKLDMLQAASGMGSGAKRGGSSSQLDAAEQTAQLEAALQSRDATIAALRSELAGMQAGKQLNPSASMPAVGRGKKK